MIHRLSQPSLPVTFLIFRNQRLLHLMWSKRTQTMKYSKKKMMNQRTESTAITTARSKAKRMHRQWLIGTSQSWRSCWLSQTSLTASDALIKASSGHMTTWACIISKITFHTVNSREESYLTTETLTSTRKMLRTGSLRYRRSRCSLRTWSVANFATIKWRGSTGSTSSTRLT